MKNIFILAIFSLFLSCSNYQKLLKSEDFRNNQIKNINSYLPYIETNESPYDISAKKILSLI